MPTVIDSLLIELSLDSTKFDAAQKKSIESLRKFDDANQKSSKGVQENSKKASEGVLKTKDAIDSLNSTNDDTKKTTETVNRTNTSMGVMGKTAAIAAVAIAGFKVLKDFSVDLIDSNAQLGRMSALLGESPQQITAWGTVLKGVGGTADDFTSSMQNIEGSLARLKMGFGGTQILRPLGMLGVALSDAGNPDKIQTALQKYSKLHGEQQALVLAQEMGINGNTFQAMINRSGTLKSQYAQGLKSSNISTAQTDKAEEQLRKIAQISSAADGAKQVFKMQLDPAIDKTLTEVDKLGNGFNDLNSDIKGVLTTTAAVVTGLGAAGLAIKALRLLMPAATVAGGTTAAVTATEVAGGAAAGGMAARIALMSSRLGSAGLALGGGYALGTGINYGVEHYGFHDKASIGTKLYDWMHPDGTTTRRTGNIKQTRGVRNNNLGNIEKGRFADKYGAIAGKDSRFATFPTPEAGHRAMVGLIRDAYGSKGIDTISGIINRYAPSSENNTGAYINAVSKGTGINPNVKLSSGQYDAIAMMMERHESGVNYQQMMGSGIAQSGKASATGGSKVETNIQAINIHTQATDANGIAKSARQALHDHQLIGTATLGVM